MRLHYDGVGGAICSENGHKRRPWKGPTGIGKKSRGTVRGLKEENTEDNEVTLEPASVTFDGDDANMSRPVSPSRNENISIADCSITDAQEPFNCPIDVNNVKVEANSMSSSDFCRVYHGGTYDYSNSLSSNDASVSLPVAVKSEAIYDSNSQPALGAATSGIDTWKCNQCKVAFESGPQLLEHLDEIRRAEHKVIMA